MTALLTIVLAGTVDPLSLGAVGLRDRGAWEVLVPHYQPADVIAWQDRVVLADAAGGVLFFDPVAGTVDVLTTLDGLTSNALTSLDVDDRDQLWIGTRGGGVVRVDPDGSVRSITAVVELDVRDVAAEEDFLYYATSRGVGRLANGLAERVFTEDDGLLDDDVVKVAAHDGRAWFGTPIGVSEYDRATNVVAERNDGIVGSREVVDLDAGPGGVFLATPDGVLRLGEDDQWQPLVAPPAPATRIRHVDGRLIMMASADRAFELPDGGSAWSPIELDVEGYDYSVDAGPAGRLYAGPVLGPEGTLWFGAVVETPGLNRGDPHATLWRPGLTDPLTRRGLFGSDVRGLATDGEGGAWLGTFPVFDSVTHWRGDGSVVAYLIEDDDLEDGDDFGWIPNSVKIAIFEDRRGDVWVSAFQNGVTRLRPSPADDPAEADYLHLRPDDSPLRSRRVLAIAEDPVGNVWFGSDGEVVVGDLNTGIDILLDPSRPEDPTAWSKVTPDNSELAGPGIRSLDFDGMGVVWLSIDGVGLQRWVYDADGDGELDLSSRTDPLAWKTIDTLPATVTGEELESPRGVVIDREGFLWLATEGKGVFRFDPSSGLGPSDVDQLERSDFGVTLLSNQIRDLVLDGDGAIWAASDAGLDRIVREDDGYRVEAFTDFAAFDAFELGSNGYLPDVISPLPGSNVRTLAYGPSGQQVFVATQTGSARVRIDVLRSLRDTDADFMLHPNPMRGRDEALTVSGFDGEATVQVYNLLGVLLQERTGVRENEEVWDARTITGAPVASGLYVVRLISSAGSAQKTLAVER